MVELLLNVLYATRAGNWNLYLVCTHSNMIILCEYLTPLLGEMLNLEINRQNIYREFSQGNFAFQLNTSNSFGKVEAYTIMETTKITR